MKPHKLLQALILSEGVTLSQLARKVKVSQPTLHNFMTGRTRNPKWSNVKRLTEYFNVPTEAFFDEKVAKRVARERGLAAPPEWESQREPRIDEGLRAMLEAMDTPGLRAVRLFLSKLLEMRKGEK
jgi:transcriptional regulator with XRE-family HTH domain